MSFIQTAIPFVPILPLIGALILGFFGKRIQASVGEFKTGILGCLTPGLAAVISFASFFVLITLEPEQRVFTIHLTDWISVAELDVQWAFRYDPLSALMLMIVTGIGTLIHIYSMGYMHDDQSYWRFFSYINLFLAAMLLLVLGDNLVIMFLGWEGVGLCSYLLIGFWFSDSDNAQAGKKAFLFNRVGDLGFITGIFLLYLFSSQHYDIVTLSFGELDQRALFLSKSSLWDYPLLEIAALCFFIGAMGKSAQIPLYVWLPDAMAGPTPVSALIHAATMVTAGVYMIGRMYFLFALAPNVLMFVSWIAALTCFFSATIGMAQFDIKKVLAYSTVSQLGYMFLAMGVGAFSAGIFHLLTHAAFKAALFMGSGSVIVALHHKQDMREMGGLLKKMPVTGWSMIAATLAIMGFPLTSGFFSKDEILWKAYMQGSPALWLIGFTAAGITSFYMWRLIFMTFFGESRCDKHTWDHVKEQPKRTVVPIAILAFLALVLGFLNIPHFLGGHSGFTDYLSPVVQDLEIAPSKLIETSSLIDTHVSSTMTDESLSVEEDHTQLEWTLMILSVLWTIFTGLIAFFFYYLSPKTRQIIMSFIWAKKLFQLLSDKYYIDELYEIVIITPIKAIFQICSLHDQKVIDGIVNFAGFFGKWIAKISAVFDNQIVDGCVNGTGWLSQFSGQGFSRLQSGKIQSLVGASLLVGIGFIVLLVFYFI
ncbi:MAG: NADH-quinone oxidoreductase subunit L [Deltaproteobacteria bacterium]|nr:NADH-quinone oxidoreductase subunit L [Deltaproteobacteria bacterium]